MFIGFFFHFIHTIYTTLKNSFKKKREEQMNFFSFVFTTFLPTIIILFTPPIVTLMYLSFTVCWRTYCRLWWPLREHHITAYTIRQRDNRNTSHEPRSLSHWIMTWAVSNVWALEFTLNCFSISDLKWSCDRNFLGSRAESRQTNQFKSDFNL